MYVHVYALPFHVCRGQRTALAISFLIPLWDSGISLLTETKINRNVKKNLMVMTTAFFSVTTGWRQRAHRKKTSAPEVLQGVGCARFVPARVRGSRPGWRIRPREAVAFSSPGGCPWIDTGSASILDRKSGPGAHGSCSVSRA